MIFCARATRGRGLPSPGRMARLGVPRGGRVRKLRAVEDQSGLIPVERTSNLGGPIYSLARRLPSDQHWRQAYRETNLPFPETGEHLILHFQKIGATFQQEATQHAEAA
jgi:hypothetical protein